MARAMRDFASAGAGGKGVFNSEFGMDGCYCGAVAGLADAGVGWILWELMVGGDVFRNITGIVNPDGSPRSAVEAACIHDAADSAPAAAEGHAGATRPAP